MAHDASRATFGLARAIFTAACMLLISSSALAQSTPSERPSEASSRLDDSAFLTPRTLGMAGAILPIADDLDAALTNPAGIGGYQWGQAKLPWIRKLYFPWTAVSVNADSQKLAKEFSPKLRQAESAATSAAHAAQEGKAQYARASFAAGTVVGRFLILPFADQQLAAAARREEPAVVDVHTRTSFGAGAGFSVQDPSELVSLGYFASAVNRQEIAGAFTAEELDSAELRREAFAAHTTSYAGVAHHVGVNVRPAVKKWSPALAIALKDVGDTRYRPSKGPGAERIQKQDLSVGASLSPKLGKWAQVNLVAEAGRLLQSDESFTSKYRLGAEMTAGGFGSYALVAARVGYHDAGAAFGLALNFGLIGIEAAHHAVDVGAAHEKVIERRNVGTFYVNVADF